MPRHQKTWLPHAEAYRVKSIDGSLGTYCAANTIFSLTEDGLEDPNCDFVLLEFQGFLETKFTSLAVEFNYQGGRYVGKFNPIAKTIWDISSL